MTGKLKTEEDFTNAWMQDLLEVVDDDIDDNWRHGNNHSTVFELFEAEVIDGKLEWSTTNEFYRAQYQKSGDGEYHGIREGSFNFEQVEPYDEVVTVRKWKKVE